jgi:hypothetical protein
LGSLPKRSFCPTIPGVTPSRLIAVLKELRALQETVARLEFEVVSLIRENGATWETIAEELDISRQAAARRFARPKGRRI